MNEREWSAISEKRRELIAHINVKEMVYYLKEQIKDPPLGTLNFSPLDISVELEEINDFQDHNASNLLEYLRRRKFGFELLCNALHESSQGFLVEILKRTYDGIPEVDSSNFYVPDSRYKILHNIAERLQRDRCYINLHGERGVGTSCFLDQVTSYLREICYFTVHTIDLTDTPLVLQNQYFFRLKHELVSKERAMKKYCVFCIDNCNSLLLDQRHRHQDYQKKHVDAWCKSIKELGVSLLTTSTEPRSELENVEIKRLTVKEMRVDIHRMFPNISTPELIELSKIFPEEYCNPLNCFLVTALYLLHDKRTGPVRGILTKHPHDRDELFVAVFEKLNRTQQEILLSVYSLPCNAKVSIPSICSLYSGTSRPPEEHQLEMIEAGVQELVDLNLLRKNEERYSMKDSNFFYHFRTFFYKKHLKRLRVFYLRGLHHYLDYIIKFINDVQSLNVCSQSQDKEWQDAIPCISLVLDPFDKALEDGILLKPRLSKPVFIKRIFIIEKLRNMALDIPSQIIVLTARYLLDDFDTYHYKYAEIEDKAKMLCLITELTLTPHFDVRDARDNLTNALHEVKLLLEKDQSEAFRVKYYMRILVPLGEIYIKERNYDKARDCFKECLKLKCDNKTVNWMLRKRLRYVNTMLRGAPPVEAASPMSPVDVSNKNFLSQDIKYHLEMGDSFYLLGDLPRAFNYYFELWRKFHSKHLHLKEQEYILVTMGHLKLQQHPFLTRPNVEAAIKFYEESNCFFKLRKHHDSEFLRICLLTANLLASRHGVVRKMVLELRNAQEHTRTEFFIAVTHKDTNHRFLWRELTCAEKEHHTNRIKAATVNYYLLEAHHYSMKLNQFRSEDMSRFVEFPSPDLLDNVDKFNPSILFRQNDLHLGIYIKIASTRI